VLAGQRRDTLVGGVELRLQPLGAARVVDLRAREARLGLGEGAGPLVELVREPRALVAPFREQRTELRVLIAQRGKRTLGPRGLALEVGNLWENEDG
jgi:hypothetical protein